MRRATSQPGARQIFPWSDRVRRQWEEGLHLEVEP
jgi:hypothetical protein